MNILNLGQNNKNIEDKVEDGDSDKTVELDFSEITEAKDIDEFTD